MKKSIFAPLAFASLAATTPSIADSVTGAITGGKAFGDFRLRYEEVDQDNALENASALTLRTRLGYTTAELEGFSATVEMEDVRIVGGEGDYTVGPTGYKVGEYSVIADPEVTELDQGFVQYKQGMFSGKLGRQVIAYDGHRFVGHVGWRQDRQTFDAARVDIAPIKGVSISYAYVDQRNRIFAEAADMDSKDHLLNAAIDTPIGKLVLYNYMLEVDDGSDNARDTFGASLTGAADAGKVKLHYAIEFASQESEAAGVDYDADYSLIEAGATFSGISARLGREILGSDEGNYGFTTELATLHKFNGWADLFLATPATGLVDSYVSLSGSLLGGGWNIVYHEFAADEDTPTLDEYGTELNISYARKFGKSYNAGIKYANYDADDLAVDTERFWFWMGLSF